MANELAALAEVAADAIDRLALTPAQTLHAAIARRVFASTPASAPSRVIHDGVAAAAYAAVRGATAGAAGLAGIVARATSDSDARSLSRSPRGRFVVGGLNGVAGDRLVEMGNALAIEMAVRSRGADVACTRGTLRRAFPHATSRLVVFLHGLAETEEWWLRNRHDATGAVLRPFGVRLREDAGLTPVSVRYNTGLHVSDSGRTLAALLDSLAGAWPVAVDELVLVGHSMGGLVVRSACHAGAEAGHAWPKRVRNVVTLGTPHHGAPIAKMIHAAAWMLRAVPESTPFADILDLRSAGIRDMRFGSLHDDDWRDEDRSALLGDTRRDVPLMPHCRYTFITATVTRDARNPLGWFIGDLLVRTESAGGRCREHTIPIDPESVVHLGGLSHFDLLDHPAVYDVLRGVLA
jgi:pimeloyl-ACP methyl ester carboxylesterase